MISKEFGDNYIGAKVLLHNGDKILEARVTSNKIDANGKLLLGTSNLNLLLEIKIDNRIDNITFPDDTKDEFSETEGGGGLTLSFLALLVWTISKFP